MTNNTEISEDRKMLAQLRRERAELEKTLNKRVVKGKIRVNCYGPTSSEKCSYGEYNFFKERPKWKWICKKCWRLRAERDKKRIIIWDENGPTPEYKKRLEVLDQYTGDIVETPKGRMLRVGVDGLVFADLDGGKPLQEDLDWFKIRYIWRPEDVPNGFFWCAHNHTAYKQIEKGCDLCPVSTQCSAFQVVVAEKKVKVLERKLAPERRFECDARTKTRVQSNIEREREKDRKRRYVKEILDSYGEGMLKWCDKKECPLETADKWWAFDGVRWVRQIRGKYELKNPRKKMCDKCYKKRKR